MKMLNALVILLLILLLFPGCSNDGDQDGNEGALHIRISRGSGLSVMMNPPVLEISSYEIIGEGPGGETCIVEDITDENVLIDGLVMGAWDFHVIGYDISDTAIAEDSAQVAIEPGGLSEWNALLTPINGVGSVLLEIEWPEGLGGNLTPVCTLTPFPSGNEILLEYSDGTVTGNSLPTGYYSLSISLMGTEDQVWGNAYALRILAEQTVEMSLIIPEDEMDLSGSLDIIIDADLFNPLEIGITGKVDEFTSGDPPIHLSVDITDKDEDLTYSCYWYLDGSIVFEESSNTLNIPFSQPGVYRIAAVVYAQDNAGMIVGAGHESFSVAVE